MPLRAPPPPLPTIQPPPPTVRPDRFRRVLASTLPRGPVTTPGEDAADAPSYAPTAAWPWPTPPSPVDFDTPAARQASRARAVRRHVRKAKGKAKTAVAAAWPTLSPVTYDPPPATQAEREYQQLRRRHDAAEARLKTLYADVHLRLYVLGLLRPADYSELGLGGALDAWVGASTKDMSPRLSRSPAASS